MLPVSIAKMIKIGTKEKQIFNIVDPDHRDWEGLAKFGSTT
jgi:hypothetical protein